MDAHKSTVTDSQGAREETHPRVAEFGRLPEDLMAARRGFEESLKLARELNRPDHVAASLRRLAELDQLGSDYAAARRGFEESLKLSREISRRDGIAASLRRLAQLDLLQGNYAAARRGFEESLKLSRELNRRNGAASSLHSLAELDRLQGDYPAARRRIEQSLQIARELNRRDGIAACLHGLAELDRLRGGYAAAQRGFAESLAIARQLGLKRNLMVTTFYLEAAKAQADASLALDGLQEAVAVAKGGPDPAIGVRACLIMAQTLQQRSSLAEARKWLNDALAQAKRHGLRGLVAFVEAQRGLCLAAAGATTEAATASRAALRFFAEQQVRHPETARLWEIASAVNADD